MDFGSEGFDLTRRETKCALVPRSVLCLSSAMAEAAVIEASVDKLLSESRNDVELPGALVASLKEYLLKTLQVKEVSRDAPSSTEEWVNSASEAWELSHSGALPALMASRVKRWALTETFEVEKSKAPACLPPGLGATAKASTYDLIASELGVSPAQIHEDFDAHQVSSHTRSVALSDMKAQGMLPSRILGLSLAMETGSARPDSEIVGMGYGNEIGVSSLVKDLRKAGKDILSELLKEGKMHRIQLHLNGVIRDLGVHQRVREVALLSAWMGEWTLMFVNEDAMAVAYLKEYLKIYAGRGLPVEFDFRIYFRAMKAYGKDGEAFKELAKEVKGLKGNISQLTDQCSSHKAKITQLQSTVDALKSKVNISEGGGAKGIVCNYCKKKGHFARDCPKKKEDEEEEDEK